MSQFDRNKKTFASFDAKETKLLTELKKSALPANNSRAKSKVWSSTPAPPRELL